jgi:hypothetical protein
VILTPLEEPLAVAPGAVGFSAIIAEECVGFD